MQSEELTTLPDVATFDYLEANPPPQFKVLDDGFVRLVDMMPRRVPIGRSPDFAIIRNARVSTGQGLKSEKMDRGLLRYLYINQHSTPFESVVLCFHLRLPRFVATHFHRHRTASINEFSQRYAQVDEDSFFHPSQVEGSLRIQTTMSKQGSDQVCLDPRAQEIMEGMEEGVGELFSDYKALLALGIGKEVARSHLPLSTYTEMYYQMNLRNLLHFIQLRYDKHTQKETQDYAEAMYKIMCHVVPETMQVFDDVTREGMSLSRKEIEAISSQSIIEGSATEKAKFLDKLKRLGLGTPEK